MKFAAIGEVLFDVFQDHAVLGGAPANVCCMMKQFGFDSYLISSVGDDDLGHEACDFLRSRGLDLSLLDVSSKYKTGKVNVELDCDGKASYQFDSDSAYDHIEFNAKIQAVSPTFDAVIWGSLAQRNQSSGIIEILKSLKKECFKVFDVNLRAPFYTSEVLKESIKITDMVKLNDEELPILAQIYQLSEDELIKYWFEIGVKYILVTCGKNGSKAYSFTGEYDFAKASEVKHLVDTVGAGDAFGSAFIASLLKGKSLKEANLLANKVAAFVCSKRGATPILPVEVLL